MRIDILYLTLLLNAATIACERPAACPESVIMIVTPDASIAAQDPDDEPFDLPGGYASPVCLDACLNLKRQGCPEGVPRPGEDSCYIVCRRAQATGGRVDFRPACVAAASNRTEIQACKTYRCN